MGQGQSKLTKSNNNNNNKRSTSTTRTTYAEVVRNGRETTFTARAIDGWSYGRNPEIVEYFRDHSNIDVIINKLTDEDMRAWKAWARGEFMGSASTSYEDLPTYMQAMLRRYDKTIDQSIFSENFVIRTLGGYSTLTGDRAVPSDAEWAKIVNQPVKLKMPMSSAAAATGLTIGSWGKNVEYKWHIPAGVKGVALPLVDKRINPGWKDEQREVVVNRDRFWKPGNRRYDKTRGLWIVDMYYVGADRHDYGKK